MNIVYLILSLISAATLAFQITLTRFFSLAQGSHLAFMAVSLALLGAGASGTYLSLHRPAAATLPRLLTWGSILFTLSVPAAYLAINYLPFDAYRLAWERVQLLWLVLYYLALTVPFFFSGLVIGAVLATHPDRAGQIYAANLLGSGFGPPLALAAMATVGGPGTVFLCALLGCLAGISGQWYLQTSNQKRFMLLTYLHSNRKGKQAQLSGAVFLILVLIPLAYFTLVAPALFDVRLTPYKSLSQAQLYPGSEIIFSQWNAFSRVDVLRSEGIRSAPGLSFTYRHELPPQVGLTVDGDNLVPITNPTHPTFTKNLPLALGFALRPDADVLILEPGGGLAVLTALQNGARSVTVVQSNFTVAEVVGQHLADFSGHLYDDPRVEMIIDSPRSYLRRTDQHFNLIILPLTDSFRPVTAGAYALNEDYRYTVEAFSDGLAHLSPGGLLLAERWLQLPPSESLRLWGVAVEALRAKTDCAPALCRELLETRLIAIRSLQTSLIGVAESPLLEQDLQLVRQFAVKQQFDLVWLPELQPHEANRYSIVPKDSYYRTFTDLLAASRPVVFYADYPYAVAPSTDNHPFFFHFFKWNQIPEILQTLGKTWQPFGGSGYLVLVVLLALVLVLSTVLILFPLLPIIKGRKSIVRSEPGLTIRFLLYFTLLGLGFLFVEIPLLQHFILYLGQPAYAFAVVVSTILVAAGVGSGYLSQRLPLRVALGLIFLLAIAYPWLLPHLFNFTLQFRFAGRVAVTIMALLPLGTLLGVPFPRGMMLVGQTAPGLTPWVWAVNGCASVVSAVLAAMIALTWGFSAVLWSAALAYALAGLTMTITAE